jgi:acyl carrier protein
MGESMIEHGLLCSQLEYLFVKQLEITVPSYSTNLIDEGIIDSLTFVELLDQLEQNFNITISLEDMEINDFISIDHIGHFVQRQIDVNVGSICINSLKVER